MEPIEGRAEVVELGLQSVEPLLGVARHVRIGLLGERQEVLSVAQTQRMDVARRFEPLGGVFADGLQHPEALAGVAHQALVDQRLKRVDIGLSDLLSSDEGPATSKDSEAGEGDLLLG